jgi:hypothetical protein
MDGGAIKMGMKRTTYEQRFRRLYEQVIQLVENEMKEWCNRGIEVSRLITSPHKIVWTINWDGQPINALSAAFRHDAGGYPYIVLYSDRDSEGIYALHRKQEKLEEIFQRMRSTLDRFAQTTIMAEAKRIALKEGFLATMADNYSLTVYINDCSVMLKYFLHGNAWKVWASDLKDISGKVFECGEQNPLRFFHALLKALALTVSL